MTLRKFWKAMKWWSRGCDRSPLYRKIGLGDVARVEALAMEKHERRMSKCR